MPSLKERIQSLLKRKGRKQQKQQPLAESKPDTSPASATVAASAPAPAAAPASAPASTTEPPADPSKPAPLTHAQQKNVRPNVKVAATASGTLQIALQNQSNTDQMWAYITGQAIDNNFSLFLLQADGQTPYYPASPSATGTGLGADIAIPMGVPGSTRIVTIPRIAGGRIWFSTGSKLVFLVNPGPGLVEPSVFNPADPNANTNFSFCEFTFNSAQLFANISYVDFVSGIPLGLTLWNADYTSQHVSGMDQNGLETVSNGLRAQAAKDGQPWGSLIVQSGGQDLRVLSPNSGNVVHPGLFQGYYTPYVDQVYSQYRSQPLIVNTQASFGNVTGLVNNSGNMDFGSGSVFTPPSAGDVFSSNTGPFATGGNTQTNVIIPRLAAAFNRSTLLLSNQTPNGTNPSQYYENPITNHYARIVHSANLDGLGYAHPYDDVVPDGGASQAGIVTSGDPTLLIIAAGGYNAFLQ